ncbi:MAG: hypothetical protein QM726_10930 [Chitinophagaceae bacterium]
MDSNFMRIIIIITLLSLTVQSCSSKKENKMGFFDRLFGKKDSSGQSERKVADTDKATPVDSGYQSKLIAAKQFYPFESWRESYKNGMTQYTEANCNKTKKIFDDLISSLITIGKNASESEKIEQFKIAILKTNKLSEEIDDLIETGEREDLCELTNKITIACGLDPHKYGEGEGLATEWREW